MKRLHGRISQPPYKGAGGFVLSVSGGMDSMVLLDLFRCMAHVHEVPIRVVHFHHGTGAFADNARVFLESYCNINNIPLALLFFKQARGNFEYEAARFRRTQLDLMRGVEEWVLLGHHLQDQGETCLQTLVRGAGVATPLGMVMEHAGRLRPFLDVDRSLIAEHARLRGVPHLLDPSNDDRSNFRNMVRHEIMPKLKRTHDHFEARLAGFATDLSQLRFQLEREARNILDEHFISASQRLPRTVFKQYPVYLWDFILRQFWQMIGAPTPKRREQEQLRCWLDESRCGSFSHGGKHLWCDQDSLVWEAAPARESSRGFFGQQVEWGPWRLLLHNQGTMEAAASYQLQPVTSRSKKERELLRCNQVPQRVRANIPIISWGDYSYSLFELITAGKGQTVAVEAIHPPDLPQLLGGSRQ